MAGPLLGVKYQLPATHGLLARPRLDATLERAWSHALTLVVAPAGAGKTALAASWAARSTRGPGGRAVAWLTLDAADADPARFGRYLRAALRAAAPALGPAMQGEGEPEQLLDNELNALAALNGELALVLEDLHLVDSPAVHRAVARLVDYAPPHLHLVVTARRSPPLPLARWRARGALCELGPADLRFTPDEAEQLVAHVAGRPPPADAAAALTAQADGWAAGIRLAAGALREHPAALDAALHSARRHIGAYLLEEVFGQLPPAEQALVRAAAILNRLCPELCDFLAQRAEGEARRSAPLLAQLARDGLLLAPLDEQGRWYRLHPLLRAALEEEARRAAADRAVLHRRAAEWFAERGLLGEAFDHALAGGAPDIAARALAAQAPALIGAHNLAALHELMARLPQPTIRAHPSLCCAQIWLLLDVSRPAAAEAYLRQLEQGPPGELGADVLALHAVQAAITGQAARALALAREAEQLRPADDPLARALVAFGLGAAYKMGNRGGRAEHCLREAAAAATAADNRYLASEAYANNGDLLIDLGRLPEAAQALRQALALARSPEGAELPAAGWIHWDLGRVAYEWNDLEAARGSAARAVALCERWGNAAMWARSLLLAAQVAHASGDAPAALALLDDAERVAQLAEGDQGRQLVARRRLALAIAQRQLEPARHLVELLEVRAARPAPASHELVMAQWCLAVGQPADARAHLHRARRQLDETNLVSGRIQAYILEALAGRALGQSDEALATLEQALALARPGRFARSFLDAGAPLRELLRRAAERSAHAPYIGALLDAFDPPPATSPLLAEPPTGREMAVLRLLAAGYSNRDIAGQLVIAESTAKRHVSNLYLKLGVQSRTQAVARAGELGLLC